MGAATFTVRSVGTRLRPGDVIDMGLEGPARVVMVNESRARIRFLTQRQETFEADGKTVSFQKLGRFLDISPNSEVPIL